MNCRTSRPQDPRTQDLKTLRLRRPRPRLYDREALFAERTFLGLVGFDVHWEERVKWHFESLLAAAAIAYRVGADDNCAGGAGHVHRFARRSAGRHHVLDDDHFLTRL